MEEIRTAMGYVETVGLAAAIAAADAALKAANVRLIGREISKGGGMVTVKLSGNVGAVRAAVDAARAEGERVSEVVSALVIARPAHTHGPVMGYNADTMGVTGWLEALGVKDIPVSVFRPEGERRGSGPGSKAKLEMLTPVEDIVPEIPAESGLAAKPGETVHAPEAVSGESVVPNEPAKTETVSEVPEKKTEDRMAPKSEADEPAVAETIPEETAPEVAEATEQAEAQAQRSQTPGRKTASGKTQGEASGRSSKRRTRRKKASDSENNETSGRS